LPEYIWMPEALLPPDAGFTPLGHAHLAVLALLAVLSGLVVAWGCVMDRPGRLRLMRVMAGLMVAMEIAKDLILWRLGAFGVGYLPLHLCSLDMLICLWAAWLPDSDAGGQLLWSLCFSGGLAALLFPDWSRMPLYHFQSVHSFVYHAMLVQISLMAVISGQAKPRVQRLWKVGLFLIAAAIPVYWIDQALNTNYMFLLRPVPGTPLELCARLAGRWGYLLGYGLLAAAVLLLLDLPFSLWVRKKQPPEP